jgi:hypothetical protein
VNFAFVVVVVAAVSGISSDLALRAVAPEAGPVLALFIMSVACLVAAARVGRVPAGAGKREQATAAAAAAAASSTTHSGLHQLPT